MPFPSGTAIAFALSITTAAASSLRGWNSWDSFLGNPNETQVLGIAAYMATNLLPFGYDVLTIDEGWYDAGGGVSLDAWGRPTPHVSQYPSASDGRGFFNLSSQVHAAGLRFGVWTIRGIPEAAVAAKLPIEGSLFTADQAASPATPCNWSSTCYGCATVPSDGSLRCNDAAYAYYRSLARWYVAQGIDVVKMDCMFPAQVTRGVCGRGGLLVLSPSLPRHSPWHPSITRKAPMTLMTGQSRR